MLCRSAAEIGSDAAGGASSGSKHLHRRRGGGSTAAPSSPSHECPLNGLLNVTAFDAQFDARYRENSFLRHPLVPPAVRDDRTPAQDVYRRTNTTTKHASSTDLLPTTGVQLSVDDVLRRFGSYSQHVLVFRALYGVQPRFDSDDEQRTFDERVHKAFRRGTYRQLSWSIDRCRPSSVRNIWQKLRVHAGLWSVVGCLTCRCLKIYTVPTSIASNGNNFPLLPHNFWLSKISLKIFLSENHLSVNESWCWKAAILQEIWGQN